VLVGTTRRYTAPKGEGKPWGILPCAHARGAAILPSVHAVSDLNKRKVRLFVEAVWNDGHLELIEELVADDYVGRIPGAGSAVLGPAGVRRHVSSRRRAHPDLHIRIEDQIAEEDRVATRWHATVTAAGTPRCGGISIVRLLAGKLVDSHTQLGAIDQVGARLSARPPSRA
jgi:predicted SnoaL-like aldol condensation-catalyzing enzyme